VHANLPVSHLVPGPPTKDGGLSVVGLKLSRAPNGPMVPVDGVVLCAGAMGSPALMLRSVRRNPRWRRLAAWRSGSVGTGVGFNYGTAVLGRWEDRLKKPGRAGVQVAFVATKPEDESFIIENGWIPPALLSAILPTVGPDHRRLMGQLDSMGLCVNTIGSTNDGTVDHQGDVSFRVGASAMATIHESLASMVAIYLASGAVEVRLSGLRSTDDSPGTFDPSWLGREADLRRRIEQIAPTAEHLALSSGHPQGGLRMNASPDLGAVDGDFRMHGAKNLWVADASVFPTTITINPQWLVSSLAWVAGDAIAAHFA